jgi:hypothetical protein
MAELYELPPPDLDASFNVEQVMNSNVKPAEQRYVRFHLVNQQNPEKSRAEGRPIFDAVEFIEILTPGDKDTIINRPVRPKLDPYLYPEKYVAFRRGQTQQSGTPLEIWGALPPERIAELAYFHIHTVDALADVADEKLAALGMSARSEREKARRYLAALKDAAPVAELKAENDSLRKRLEALEAVALANTVQSEGVPVEAPANVKRKEARAK